MINNATADVQTPPKAEKEGNNTDTHIDLKFKSASKEGGWGDLADDFNFDGDGQETDPLLIKGQMTDSRKAKKNRSWGLSLFTPTGPESESLLSMRHLSEGAKVIRTTDPITSQFNMLNMYVGIALIALPKAVSEAGIIAAIGGIIFIDIIALAASYFILKARNRFKRQRIIDFPDLAYACYGPNVKRVCEIFQILANTTFVMAQSMYLGGQADLFACNWFNLPDQCGKNRSFYSFVMVSAMSPIFLIPDFKKLGALSGFFILCCITSIICIWAIEIYTIH